MIVEQTLVCDHCSLGCCHCPYGVKTGIDFYPDTGLLSPERVVHVVTGGEPMESGSFPAWVRHYSERNMPFRVATAGYISMRRWSKRLALNRCFLGFNIDTDILTNRCSPTKSQMSVWTENWEQQRKKPGTWMTITLGDGLDAKKAHEIINRYKPKIVLLNGQKPISDGAFSEFECLYPEIGFVHGFNTIG